MKPRLTVASMLLLVFFVPAAAAAPGAPVDQTAPSISGTPVQGNTLTVSPGSWSGSPTRFTYVWRRCRSGVCATIAAATASTYVLQQADVGYSLRVVVKAWNASGSGTARSNRTAVVTATAADTTPPSVPGNLTVSSTTASSVSVTWTASTDNVGVTGYNAYRNGSKVWTGSATAYTFAGLACGTTYTLAVAAADAAGNLSTRASRKASTVSCGGAPSNTAPPVVSGTAKVGQVLTTTTGSWSGAAPIAYAYQWKDCDSSGNACTAIAGATGSSYTLGSADQGHTLRVAITASNGSGSSAASSTQTAVVQAPSQGLTGIAVSGNKLVDGSGAPIRLHGVNYSGTEYACIQGWGIFDGPSDGASVKAIASWHANIVHIGLNEDCVLGINGVSSSYAGANYMNAIVAYVNLLHANGLYAEVSLMWAAPGSRQALDHPQILDQDHAPAALRAIANAFKSDPNTIIGLQSEPHDISWACWKGGGSACSVGYTALGMQGAVDAVRSTGATNVLTASGISYANDLSQWLANEPTDPSGRLIAEAHVYGGNSCASTACFNANYAPVAAQVPLLFGETGETYDASSCASANIAVFIAWADAHGVGYEPWTWDTWGNCSSLISDFNGTPANAYGQWVHDHFVATFP